MRTLTVSSASKTYPGASSPVFEQLNLTLKAGEAYLVLGATGSGKSTLLRAVAGLETLDSGTIDLHGARLAMVFQQPALFPWLNVRQNIALGTGYRANAGRVDNAYLDHLLTVLGLADLAERTPAELSGGQAQRVSIGRALAIKPSLLLLDEPFSALDPATRSELHQWLRGLIKQLGVAVLMVSHDITEALTLGHRIGFFTAGKGFTREWSPAEENIKEADILEHYQKVASSSNQAPDVLISAADQLAGVGSRA